MSLFAIGDTHLSLGTDKPMNIFADGTTMLKDSFQIGIG